jgi:hypothetical protein
MATILEGQGVKCHGAFPLAQETFCTSNSPRIANGDKSKGECRSWSTAGAPPEPSTTTAPMMATTMPITRPFIPATTMRHLPFALAPNIGLAIRSANQGAGATMTVRVKVTPLLERMRIG